ATGGEGDVYFPFPFASPPQLTFTHTRPDYVTLSLVSVSSTGFRWKAVGASSTTMSWTAKGVQATLDQVLSLPREQSGELSFDYGHDGEVVFPRPYVGPPSVDVGHGSVIVASVSATGFKWRDRFSPNRGKKTYANGPLKCRWTARGTLAPLKSEKK